MAWWADDLPVPVVPARRAELAEIPDVVAKLIASAEGWSTEVWYAQGTPCNAAGKPAKVTERRDVTDPESDKSYETVDTGEYRVVESIAVLFLRWPRTPQQQAWQAWWHDGKLDAAISLSGRRTTLVGELSVALVGERLGCLDPATVAKAYAAKLKLKPTKARPAGHTPLTAARATAEQYDLDLAAVGDILHAAGLLTEHTAGDVSYRQPAG